MNKLTKGFTLIELMVVILIMVIVVGMTLAVFSNFTEDRKLTKEVEKLHDVFELAKKKATASEIVGDCENFAGYRVSVSTNSYILSILCSPTPPTVISNPIQTYTLGQVQILNSDYPDVDFKPLSAGTNLGSEAVFMFKNFIISKCISLHVSPNGVVNKVVESACP